MIPVVIAPVVSRFDLLTRMLRTLTPTRRLVIVDNARSGYLVPDDITSFRSIDYIRPPVGVGYGGGINAGIRSNPDAPWWLWTSNDITFTQTDLFHVKHLVETARWPVVVTSGCTWGAMNASVVDKVGFWDDENFYPIYFDDNDFAYRCKLAGVEWIEYAGGIRHGAEEHDGSLTIRSDEGMRRANEGTFALNHQNYLAKWGGEPGHETFTSPWNTGLPVSYIRSNPSHRAIAISAWERK